MIDRTHAFPISKQARELGISRGSIYYLPRATSVADLALMRAITVTSQFNYVNYGDMISIE